MLSSAPSARQLRIGAVVYAPSFYRDEDALMRALKSQQRGAQAIFFGLYAESVEELLQRVLGLDPNLPELVSEVFRRAFAGVHGYHGAPQGLRMWVLRLAVQQATRALRWRRLRRWMSGEWLSWRARRNVCSAGPPIAQADVPRASNDGLTASGNVVELRPGLRRGSTSSAHSASISSTRGGGVQPSDEQRHDALYELLDGLPVRVRVPTALRFLAQLEIAEIAVLCDLGLSQVRQYVNDGCARLARMEVQALSWGGPHDQAAHG